MNRKLICLSVGAFCLSTFAGISTWKGGENVEWSAAGSWDGGVPAADGMALFVTTDACNTYKVTPPDDFKGTILVSNDQQVTTSYNTRYFCFNTVLDLTISENAAWKVAGSGVVVANTGLSDRLADDFVGTISIPAGNSFVASSTLNSSVEFIGCGMLTVSSVARLDHVAGFSGTILREGDAAGAGFDNMLQFHGRTFAPKDGETLMLSQNMLSFDAIKRIAAPGQNGWVFNTLNPHLEAWGRYDESKEAPYVDANGTLFQAIRPVRRRRHSSRITSSSCVMIGPFRSSMSQDALSRLRSASVRSDPVSKGILASSSRRLLPRGMFSTRLCR